MSKIIMNRWQDVQYDPKNSADICTTDGSFENNMRNLKGFFLLVGFPKTATQTLASQLSLQSEICMPIEKEPFYFNTDEYKLGSDFYWNKYFESKYSNQSFVGEAATSNSFLPFVPYRIHETIPNAKIIFSLRNPVDRAFSNWWMYYRSGLENLSFDEVVDWELKEQREHLMPLNSESDDYWKWYRRRQLASDERFIRRKTVRTYLYRGLYSIHINRYLNYFDKSDIHFVFSGDLRSNREQTIANLLDFIGINAPPKISNFDGHVAPKHPLHGWVSNKVIPIEDKIDDRILNAGRRLLNTTINYLPGRVHINDRTRSKLLAYYKKYNDELETLTGKNLNQWNNETYY